MPWHRSRICRVVRSQRQQLPSHDAVVGRSLPLPPPPAWPEPVGGLTSPPTSIGGRVDPRVRVEWGWVGPSSGVGGAPPLLHPTHPAPFIDPWLTPNPLPMGFLETPFSPRPSQSLQTDSLYTFKKHNRVTSHSQPAWGNRKGSGSTALGRSQTRAPENGKLARLGATEFALCRPWVNPPI